MGGLRLKVIGVIFLYCGVLTIYAQDLEPRLLSPIPIKSNFVIASYSYSKGNVLLDNTSPIDDLESELNSPVMGYARSFNFFNKLALFDAVLPFSFANFNGFYKDNYEEVSRIGFGDPSFRLSVILFGTKPLLLMDFMKERRKKFNFGVVFRLRVPLGQYDSTKLLNLGANRWGFKFGASGSYTFKKRLIFEGHLYTWIFTKNNNYFNGNEVYQKPLPTAQFHVSYVVSPKIWFAGSIGRSWQGETVLNGVEKNNLQNNIRYGAVFALKLKPKSALKFGYNSGISTRYGADFTSFTLAYQWLFFDKN